MRSDPSGHDILHPGSESDNEEDNNNDNNSNNNNNNVVNMKLNILYDYVEDIVENALKIQKQLQILSLNIFGPDDGFKKTYVYTAGYAALDLDIYNTKTNKLIAEVYDRRETDYTDFTRTELATRATNYRYFKRLMGKWSSNIAEQLDAFAK